MSESGPPGPTEPTGPQGPTSHRAPIEPAPLARRLLAPIAAVAVVVVVIVLLIVINGHNPKSSSAGSAPATPPAVASSSLPPTSPTSAPPTPPKRKHHHPAAKPTPAPHHTHQPAATTVAAPPNTAMADVNVLNNSRVSGLAHHVASEVGARGWQIAQVGNLQGLVATTTVYYSPGDEAAAQHLAGEFGQIQRVEPDSDGRIHLGGLTLVVTRYWTG